jgi:signal transduction histidine kinase
MGVVEVGAVSMKKIFGSKWVRAGLMVGTAAAVSLLFWYPLQSQERANIQHLVKLLVRSVATDISDEMRSRLLDQVRLAKVWELDQELYQEEWTSNAKLFMVHHPGSVVAQWIDAAYRIRWTVTDVEVQARQDIRATEAPAMNVMQEAALRSAEGTVLTYPFWLSNGKSARRVLAPIYRNKVFEGFVVVVLDDEKTIESMLPDQIGLGYGISVLENDRVLYRSDSSSKNQDKWGQEAAIDLPGAMWRVRVWPEPGLVSEIGSLLPGRALAVGSLIGLLLFLTLDFARSARLRSQDLLAAHEQLEQRIKERTAQLESTNKRLAEEVGERTQAEQAIRELSGRLLQSQDEAHRRIARELHDSTVQTLAAVAIDLEKLARLLPDGNAGKAQVLLAQSSELLERATAELRTMSYLLHPPILDDLGLEEALPWYVDGFSTRSGIKVSLEVQPDFGRLPTAIEVALFRLVQEALANVSRHSGSPTAEITLLKDEERVTLQISDRGRGIPPGTLEHARNTGATVGVGLAGMHERVRHLGGQLEILSGEDGTFIKAKVPISPPSTTTLEGTRRP